MSDATSKFTATTRINGGAAAKVVSGHVSADETWAPHIRGSIRVALDSLDKLDGLDGIDPRKAQRLTIATEESGFTVPERRTFDVGIRKRVIDYAEGELELEVASDEALMQEHKLLATSPNKGARAFESSLRGVCDWALSQVPSILRNLEPNSRAVSGGTSAPYGVRFGWALSFVQTGVPPQDGPSTVARFTSPEAGSLTGRGVDSYGNSDLAAPGTTGVWVEGPRVTPGRVITVSRWVRLSSGTQWRVRVRFHNGAGAWIGANAASGPIATPGLNNWARPFWTGVVPAGAKYVSIQTAWTTAQTVAVGSTMDMAGIMTEETDTLRGWREVALEPNAIDDRDITAQWDAVNLVRNGDAVSNVTGWATISSATTIAHNAGAGYQGNGYVSATQSAAVGGVWIVPPDLAIPVSDGDIITASSYVTHNGPAKGRVVLRWFDQNGATIKDTYTGPETTYGVGWVRVYQTGVAPVGAVKVGAYVNVTTSAAGKAWGLDKAMATAGPVLEDYFDGYTPNTERYVYAFEGPAGASASRRTATPERLPDIFNWEPGQSLWDFVTPLVEASGLRLWCDEQRLWRLDSDSFRPQAPAIVATSGPGGVTLGALDTLTRDGDEWADGVVIHHRWTDNGKTREAFDIAGTSGKVLTIQRDSAYPGPGAAAYTLQRIRGRGRVQDLRLLKNTLALPGATVYSAMPGSGNLRGIVSGVALDLQTGVVDVTTRDNVPI